MLQPPIYSSLYICKALQIFHSTDWRYTNQQESSILDHPYKFTRLSLNMMSISKSTYSYSTYNQVTQNIDPYLKLLCALLKGTSYLSRYINRILIVKCRKYFHKGTPMFPGILLPVFLGRCLLRNSVAESMNPICIRGCCCRFERLGLSNQL
jgi:hypothetical protein